MKLSRILLTITFYLLRSLNGHTQLDLLVYQCSDNFLISDNVYNGKVYRCSDSNWIVESVDISPISYGNLSLYCNFINFNCSTSKRNSNSLYSVKSHGNLLSILLLLCGDVHPCPGPTADNVDCNTRDSEYKIFKNRGLHFLHVNVRSLLPKIEDIRLLAQNSRAACIGISETWLDKTVSDSEINIQNYNIIRRDRDRHGGGVCLFIHSELAFNTRSDLLHENLEAIWEEILLPKTKPILVGIVYRPPKQLNFLEILKICVLVHLIVWNVKLLY